MYENSELNAYKNTKSVGENPNIWPYDLFGTNVYKTLECFL